MMRGAIYVAAHTLLNKKMSKTHPTSKSLFSIYKRAIKARFFISFDYKMSTRT